MARSKTPTDRDLAAEHAAGDLSLSDLNALASDAGAAATVAVPVGDPAPAPSGDTGE